ncbi:alpha/beta hydrolase [Streptomyces sp. NPDC006309]|uniref:alpha/beta hydrolase n=1 Tax=Streptomyces sp. NPDC006309 TaxID=3156749 RepID=UPI0033B570A0
MAGTDPELEAFVPFFVRLDLTDPAAARPAPDTSAPTVEDRTVPVGPDVPVRIHRPYGARGAVVSMHGGGWVLGDLDTEHHWAARIAAGSGATVISVGYRLAPGHPYPAALDDVHAVLAWTAGHAAEPGIDPARIAVGGHSSGAGPAAAVALRARDRRGPAVCCQLLDEAALDDRQETWSARNLTGTPWSDRATGAAAWRHYLGSTPATPYAAPARATDLSGLPPAYIAAAELDPNRDEDIAYARGLLRAGVASNCTSGPARSTVPRPSCPPTCPGAGSRNSPRPCAGR